jgi:hypothetical protein
MSVRFTIGLALSFMLIVPFSEASADIQIDLYNNCEPDGVIASLKESMFPESFWEEQQEEIKSALTEWPVLWAKYDRMVHDAEVSAKKAVAQMYADNPELWRPNPTRSERLQSMADEAKKQEEKEIVFAVRIQRLRNWRKCLAYIAQHHTK